MENTVYKSNIYTIYRCYKSESVENSKVYFCNQYDYFYYIRSKQLYMSISERLQMVIKMNGMNNASFADEIGVQRSSISHVLAGRNKPSIDFIQKILVTFPKVNADWLITGKKIGRASDNEPEIKAEERESSDSTPQTLVNTLKDEEREVDSSSKNDDVSTNPINKNSNQRSITKILVFYDDGTFEETVPKNQ